MYKDCAMNSIRLIPYTSVYYSLHITVHYVLGHRIFVVLPSV